LFAEEDAKYHPGVFAPLLPFSGDSFYMGESGLPPWRTGPRPRQSRASKSDFQQQKNL